MTNKKMSKERLLEICKILMVGPMEKNIDPIEVGKAIYALFITGCVSSNPSDDSIDRILAKVKIQIQNERDKKI